MSSSPSLASPVSLALLLAAEAIVLFRLPLAPLPRAGTALALLYGGWAAARAARLAWAATTPTRDDLRTFAAAFAALFWIAGNRGAIAEAGAPGGMTPVAAWLPVAAAAGLVAGWLVGLSRRETTAWYLGVAIAASGAILAAWVLQPAPSAARVVPQATGVALLLLALVSPDVARPLHDLWKPVGHGIFVGLTNVSLSVVYFVVVAPLGLLMRLTGKDPLDRRLDPAAATYWKPREPTHTGAASRLERYRRQF